MKRDWEIVRNILLTLGVGGAVYTQLKHERLEVYGSDILNRHALIMWQEGFVVVDEEHMKRNRDNHAHLEDEPVMHFAYDLTWKGHELLAMIADDGVWQEIKTKLNSFDCSVPMLVELSRQIILERIELQSHIS